MIKIIIKGDVPSKKNSRQLFVRNGRMMNIPSKNYKQWHGDALKQITGAIPKGLKQIEQIMITISPSTKRLFDLTNKAESIMDLLVDAGVLLDDNYSVVPAVHLYYGIHNKFDPNAEINICI